MQSSALAANAIFSQTTRQGRFREGAGSEEVDPLIYAGICSLNLASLHFTLWISSIENYISRDSEKIVY